MEKFLEVTYLFDFYQDLLTDKQKELLSGYYFDDLSLGELAIQHQISRQSVFDTIKKAQQKLLDHESKLGLWDKYQRQEKLLTDMKKIVEGLKPTATPKQVDDIQALETLMNQLTSEM